MVYLSVNKNTLTTSASDLLVIQKQLEICQSDVRSIQAALDSDIKECSGIDGSLSQVCSELSSEALALANMSRYLVNANDEYNKLDSDHIDDSSHVTIDGTNTQTDSSSNQTTDNYNDTISSNTMDTGTMIVGLLSTILAEKGEVTSNDIINIANEFGVDVDYVNICYDYIIDGGVVVIEEPKTGLAAFHENVDLVLYSTADYLGGVFSNVIDIVAKEFWDCFEVFNVSDQSLPEYLGDTYGLSQYYEGENTLNGTAKMIGTGLVNTIVTLNKWFS